MSTHIEWQPIKKGRAIYNSQLKRILEEEFGFPLNVNLSVSHLGFLNGVARAGIEDAQQLIDALEKYNEIHVESSE